MDSVDTTEDLPGKAAVLSTLDVPRGSPDVSSGDPLEGRVLGSYRIERCIGQGGVGRVYVAEHRALGRKVALKVLRDRVANNPVAVQRFFGEARAVNEISHENIVNITDFVQDAERSYYIMELLHGETLQELLDKGVPTLDRTLRIARQLCAAMAAVHAKGVVHRDLKPANIFITKTSEHRDFVKLLDFGVAKLSDLDSKRFHQTAAGALIGTPSYMSTEQALGMNADHRADIYTLGVILYEMVTGRRPFDGADAAEVLEQHRSAEPVPPDAQTDLPHRISASLSRIIVDCLSKNPSHRPQDMNELDARLEKEQGASRPPRWLLGVIGAGTVALVVGLLGWLLFRAPAGPAPGVTPLPGSAPRAVKRTLIAPVVLDADAEATTALAPGAERDPAEAVGARPEVRAGPVASDASAESAPTAAAAEPAPKSAAAESALTAASAKSASAKSPGAAKISGAAASDPAKRPPSRRASTKRSGPKKRGAKAGPRPIPRSERVNPFEDP